MTAYPYTLWRYVWLIVCSSQFMVAHYWKANEVKRRGEKNIQNKPVQTKSNLYINKYMKKDENEKYTSHFIERVVCERWVGHWTKLQHIDPPNSSGYHSLSFPFSWAAQPRAWGPSLCWDMVLIPVSSLQLIWTSCRRGYIIIWHPPTSCERHDSHSIQPVHSQGHPLISSTGCTCYLHRCISHLTARPGRRSICNTM